MSNHNETTILTRDVIGVLIPAGTRVELPAGAGAAITQALGGSYTIQVEGNLFRIDGSDADALGKTVSQAPDVSADASDEDIGNAVWQQLATCYDPEIPINVVDLGLIYKAELETVPEGGRRANINMTLTATGCGMGEVLVADIHEKLLQIPSIVDAHVEIVFDPPWAREMMSEAGQLQAGFIGFDAQSTREVSSVKYEDGFDDGDGDIEKWYSPF